jgi:hypothetical protein
MTLPDDWLICKQELYTHFSEGKAALDTGFKELETAGYVNKRLLRDDHGHITATEYTVFESAGMNDLPKSENRKTVKSPKSDLPFSGLPIAVNRALLSTDLTKNLEKLNTNSGGSNASVILEKQPSTTTTTEFLNMCKEAGFTLDRKLAEKILSGNPIDPAWLSGAFDFPEFAADTIKNTYPDKPPAERKRLFISALEWEDLREQYPAWRKQREQEARVEQQQEEAEARKRRTAEARRNRPATCGHCGAALATNNRTCPSCGWVRVFNDESGAWVFDEPSDFKAIREVFKNKDPPRGVSP